MKISYEQLEALKARDSGLFAALLIVQEDSRESGVAIFDEKRLSEAHVHALNRHITAGHLTLLSAKPPGQQPPPPPQHTPAEDGLSSMQRENRAAIAAHEREVEAAANARVKYWREQGLLDVPQNSALFSAWVNANPQVQYNAASIDVMINQLKPQIAWAVWSPHSPGAKPAAPVVAVEAKPQTLLDKFPQKIELVKKIRSMDDQQREQFFTRWGDGNRELGLRRVNERLAQPDAEAVEVQE
jgi:hypothetical protein